MNLVLFVIKVVELCCSSTIISLTVIIRTNYICIGEGSIIFEEAGGGQTENRLNVREGSYIKNAQINHNPAPTTTII